MNTTISQSDATTIMNKTTFELNSNFMMEDTESKVASNINPQNTSMISSSERNSIDGIDTARGEKTKQEKKFFKYASKNEELVKKHIVRVWKKKTESMDLDFELRPNSNWRKIQKNRIACYVNAKSNKNSEYDDYKSYVRNQKKMKKLLFDFMGFNNLQEAERFKTQFSMMKHDQITGKTSFKFLDNLKNDGLMDNKPLLGIISEKSTEDKMMKNSRNKLIDTSIAVKRKRALKKNNLIRNAFTPAGVKTKAKKQNFFSRQNFSMTRGREKSKKSFGLLSTAAGLKTSMSGHSKDFRLKKKRKGNIGNRSLGKVFKKTRSASQGVKAFRKSKMKSRVKKPSVNRLVF